MEMLNMMELWTGGLTIFMAVIGYIMNEKFAELISSNNEKIIEMAKIVSVFLYFYYFILTTFKAGII